MVGKEEFVKQWRKEFGCTCESAICWCDTVVKLEFVYDYLVESIGAHILSFADMSKVFPGSIGEALLPEFMGKWK